MVGQRTYSCHLPRLIDQGRDQFTEEFPLAENIAYDASRVYQPFGGNRPPKLLAMTCKNLLYFPNALRNVIS